MVEPNSSISKSFTAATIRPNKTPYFLCGIRLPYKADLKFFRGFTIKTHNFESEWPHRLLSRFYLDFSKEWPYSHSRTPIWRWLEIENFGVNGFIVRRFFFKFSDRLFKQIFCFRFSDRLCRNFRENFRAYASLFNQLFRKFPDQFFPKFYNRNFLIKWPYRSHSRTPKYVVSGHADTHFEGLTGITCPA